MTMKTKRTYLCQNCKNTCLQPLSFYEKDTGAHILFCPLCGSGSVQAGIFCSLCGGTYTKDSFGGKSCCHVCASRLIKRFKKLLSDNFSEEEIDILNEIYEGEYFN